jgi:hypothetical protein
MICAYTSLEGVRAISTLFTEVDGNSFSGTSP